MWLRVDDKFPDHPKVQGLSATAVTLWLFAACWVARYEQDGKMPQAVAHELAFRIDPQQNLAIDVGRRAIDALVDRRLWELLPSGDYAVHDFLDYNPSRKMLLRERSRKRRWAKKARRTQVSAGGRGRASSASRRASIDGQKISPSRSLSSKDVVAVRVVSPSVVFQDQGFVVRPDLLEQWGTAFPAIDVEAEIRAAHAWAVANPGNRKSNWHRFLVNWLKRSQDRARPGRRAGETMDVKAARFAAVGAQAMGRKEPTQ